MNVSDKSLRRLLTDGILIAFSYAYVYLIAYAYECGYCYHFDIPIEFINPSISTLLVAGMAMGLVLLVSYVYLGISVPLFRAAFKKENNNPGLSFVYFFNGIIIIGGILIITSYGFSIKLFVEIIGAIALINLTIFWPALVPRKNRTFIERLQDNLEAQNSDPFSITNALMGYVGIRAALVIFLFVLLIAFAFMVGNGNAYKKTEFLSMDEYPNFILVRTYGDLLILKSVDADGRVLGNKLKIIKFSPGHSIDFTQRKFDSLDTNTAP